MCSRSTYLHFFPWFFNCQPWFIVCSTADISAREWMLLGKISHQWLIKVIVWTSQPSHTIGGKSRRQDFYPGSQSLSSSIELYLPSKAACLILHLLLAAFPSCLMLLLIYCVFIHFQSKLQAWKSFSHDLLGNQKHVGKERWVIIGCVSDIVMG